MSNGGPPVLSRKREAVADESRPIGLGRMLWSPSIYDKGG